jgi:hypothetical protein
MPAKLALTSVFFDVEKLANVSSEETVVFDCEKEAVVVPCDGAVVPCDGAVVFNVEKEVLVPLSK